MGAVVNYLQVKETLTPDPDGVTTDFSCSQPYVPDSVSVWVNGRRKVDFLDDGFLELGGTTIRLKIAPLTGDTVQAQFDVAS